MKLLATLLVLLLNINLAFSATIKPNKPLNICLMVMGSQGDLDPFLTIAFELKKDGHRIRIATHEEYHEKIRKTGFEFYPIGGNTNEQMAWAIKVKGSAWPNWEAVKAIFTGESAKNIKYAEEIMFNTWNAATKPSPDTPNIPFKADTIIANPGAQGHVHTAEKLGINLHILFPQPSIATKDFPHPGFGSNYANYGTPSQNNFNSFFLVERFMFVFMGDIHNRFRKSIGLPKINFAEYQDRLDLTPHSFSFSQYIIKKPAEWNQPKIEVIGTIESAHAINPNFKPEKDLPKLSAFLKAGSPPVFVGFGSMVFQKADKLREIIIEAATKAQSRVVIQSGWTPFWTEADALKIPECSPTGVVCFIKSAPHSWLFPRMSAVIHHGGAGTTAAGLLEGKPTMIVPFFGDQYLWGAAVNHIGAGAKPIDIAHLTVENLVHAFETLKSPVVLKKVKEISDKMKTERALEKFKKHFYETFDTSHWAKFSLDNANKVKTA